MYPHVPHGWFPEDILKPELVEYFFYQLQHLRTLAYSATSASARTSLALAWNSFLKPPISITERLQMKNGRTKNTSSGASKSLVRYEPIKWFRYDLTNEDRDALARDTASWEYIAAALLGVVGDGFSISVKYNPLRKQFVCSIYRPFGDDNMHACGISAFAADIRLAGLVALYKFERVDWDNPDDSSRLDTSNLFG
jgi:hypothetical protein